MPTRTGTARGNERECVFRGRGPMNDDFASLFTYNRWADRRVLDACRKLSADQYDAEPAPGWSSVRSTVNHIALVTYGWLRGLSGDAASGLPGEEGLRTVDDAGRLLG